MKSQRTEITAFLNPAGTEELAVEISKEVDKLDEEAAVILLDQFGTVYYKASTDNPAIKIPVADMERGRYFLHINYQGEIQKKQILLE